MRERGLPLPVVYGVWEVPRRITDDRVIDSVWMVEADAEDRAFIRSVRAHRTVYVVSWDIQAFGTGRLLHEFVDGKRAR
ncbi:hypothetical protein [Pseudonocardia acaciae]|uniref:hypothetical protein n=1 Tax=Pseudonocardia acaciae TaxID=551276 RepID=UPI00048AE428|nr:hypothetical protein [Pseudonocardia acaciae]